MPEHHRPRLVPMVFVCFFVIGSLLAVVWMYAEVRRIKRNKIPRSELVNTNALPTATNSTNAP